MIILNRYKVSNMKRFKRFMFVSILLISLITFMLGLTFNAYSKDITQYEYINVKEGDTLWDIASNYANSNDIREVVYKISKINNISNSIIFPGDVIRIPLNYK